MEEMNVDEVVDVPDTPDRLAARRVIGRESVGRDSYSTVDENFRRSDTLNENHVNGLRAKDKPVTQNGHCRRPIIRPPKSFSSHRTMNFVNPNSLSPSENSFASQNSRLFRKVVVDESSSHRGKHTGGVRNMDKGKSILTDKSSHHHEGSNFFDLTKLNVCPGEPKTICPNGVIKDKKKEQISSIGNSSRSCIPESLEMFRNAFMSNEKIDENTPKGSGLATVHGVAVNLSPDSQHKTRERSSPAFTSPRVTGRRCLVRNGCISPQNIAKAELLKSSSRNIEQSYAANGVSNFAPTPRNLVTEIIAEENDNGRMKGKAILTPDTSKKQDDNFFAATSSSFATDSAEANRIINAGRNALGSQGLGGWRSTHCHSGKTDNTSHDVAGRHSRRISRAGSFSHQQHDNRVDRKESRQGHQTECDHAEGEAAVLAARSVSETGQSSGRPRAEKTVTKRLKKQGSTSRTQSECSTSVSEDPDVLYLGPSRESTNPRSSRAQHSEFRDRFCPIIEVDELSPPVRRSTPHNLDRTNDDDDSDARARQVEADEILARELQEQLYHEMPIVGGEEQVDERLAWVLQQEDDVYNTHGASQNLSHARGSMIANLIRQPRSRPAQSQPNRTRSQSNRRGTLARVANSTRMAQLRGRPYRQRRAVSHRARNLQFPLDMDLDMRLDILEALEAVVGDFGDEDMGNPIYRVQRDFNENDYEMLLALDEHNHQHAGAPSNQINSLPQSVVQTDNQEVCAICLESPTIGETVRHLPCLHKFHKDCIDPWLSRKTSCPVCKSSIT